MLWVICISKSELNDVLIYNRDSECENVSDWVQDESFERGAQTIASRTHTHWLNCRWLSFDFGHSFDLRSSSNFKSDMASYLKIPDNKKSKFDESMVLIARIQSRIIIFIDLGNGEQNQSWMRWTRFKESSQTFIFMTNHKKTTKNTNSIV